MDQHPSQRSKSSESKILHLPAFRLHWNILPGMVMDAEAKLLKSGGGPGGPPTRLVWNWPGKKNEPKTAENVDTSYMLFVDFSSRFVTSSELFGGFEQLYGLSALCVSHATVAEHTRINCLLFEVQSFRMKWRPQPPVQISCLVACGRQSHANSPGPNAWTSPRLP